MAGDHVLNRIRNLVNFGLRYPNVTHGKNVHVQWSTSIGRNRKIVIGDDVGIGKNCALHCDLRVGNKVLIAGAVAFVGSDDHVYDRVGVPIWDSGRGDQRRTIVEDDVWIGWGAIILSGATIGRGSIIAAGSVVVGDVPPYSIMIPQKARLLRRRFTPEQAAEHDDALREAGVLSAASS